MDQNRLVVVFVGGTLILMLFAFTLVIFLIVHKKKQYNNSLEKQNMESNYQHQLLLSRLEVQEESFRHFSEEIHDNIGQLLSIVKMQLYNIRRSSKEAEIVTQATDCNDLLGKAITDLRNISHTLNSSFVSKAGLAEAIEKELTYIRSAKEVSCALQVSGKEYALGGERELLIFRIMQEAMANALKHAAPKNIDVSLHYQPGGLNISITDDGSGFDTTKQKRDGGIGLNNMHVRTGLLKGTLQIDSAIEKGTTVNLYINNTATP